MDICACITESPYHTPKINTTSWINYTPTNISKRKEKNKKQNDVNVKIRYFKLFSATSLRLFPFIKLCFLSMLNVYLKECFLAICIFNLAPSRVDAVGSNHTLNFKVPGNQNLLCYFPIIKVLLSSFFFFLSIYVLLKCQVKLQDCLTILRLRSFKTCSKKL